MVMTEMTISIKLSEQDIEQIVDEMEDECNCDNSYSKEDMIAANKDELNWYKQFLDKYFDSVLKYHPAMLNDLTNRIVVGENIVEELEGQ